MILSYFIAPDKKKPDIIQLVGKILHFTDQELDQVHCTCVYLYISIHVEVFCLALPPMTTQSL